MAEKVKQFKNHWTWLLKPSFQKKANKIHWTQLLKTEKTVPEMDETISRQ